ncbi:LuxR C-terminal-related transcriptional regulator [Streptomyces sp. NPDC093991]|uniref:helix-turn-helix transcriptional regulator n=1 Tax=unclassified Streptomyces TaxID=2593676 RepID=UPI00343F09F4
MVLIQREAHLARLRIAFEDCVEQHGGRVCLISGAVGSGKTALLEAFTSSLPVGTRSVRLLTAVGSPGERNLPFGVVDQLVDSAGLNRGTARRVAASMRRLALAAPLVESADDRLEAAASGRSRNEAGRHDLTTAAPGPEAFTSLLDMPVPLVVAIDDAHHADLASVQCLMYAIRRLRSKRIMVVLTESPTLRTAHPRFRAELLSQPHLLQIGLDLLTGEGLAQMADARPAPGRARARVADEAVALTGGSPLLMRALLEEVSAPCATTSGISPAAAAFASVLAAPGATAATGPEAPASAPDAVPALGGCDGPFAQAVLRSLYRHEPRVHGTAQAMAVLGGPARLPVLAQVLSYTPEFTSQAVQLLAQAGLVDGDRLRHPHIAAVVLADLPAEERRRLHRRAAEVLHEHGAEPAVVAHHLVGADWAEPDWARPALHEAAAQALGAGRPDVTGTCLRLAARHADGRTPGQEAWTEADALLLRSRWQINPLSTHADLGALKAAADQAGECTPAALTAVPALLWQGQPRAACALVEAVEELPEPSPAVRAGLNVSRLLISLTHPDRFPEARTATREVAGPGIATSVTGRYLDAITLLADALGRTRLARDVASSAELMIQRYMADDGARGLLATPLVAMLYAGRPDLVAAWTRLLLARPSVDHTPSWKAILHTVRAEAALRLGMLDEADEQARAALTVLTPQAWGVVVAAPLGTLVAAATEAGRFEDADRWLAKPVPAETFRTPLGLHYLTTRARYHLATRRHRVAADDLRWCSQEAVAWGMDTATLVPWRLDLARTHLAFGNRAEALRLLEEQIAEDQGADGRTRGAALRQLAALVPAERGAQLLSESVQLLEACGDRVELARALTDRAQALWQAGDPDAARPLFQRAAQLAQGAGAPLLAQRAVRAASDLSLCQAKPRSAGRHTGSGLSQAERRVAALAAQGHTNRQISSKLFITVSTVEQHLTRIYRKLDVKQRADLATRLASVHAGAPHRDD